MIEINLVPDVKQELIKAQRVRSMVVTAAIFIGVASLGIVTLLAIYVFGVQAVRGSISDNEIKKSSEELAQVEDLSKTLTIQNQLTKLSALHSEKTISSRIFDLLNAVIPPAPNHIQISTLSVDAASGLVVIEGQAENSYEAVEVFKKTIEGAKIKYKNEQGDEQEVALTTDARTSNTSYGEDSSGTKVLRFTLSFTYAPELLATTSKEASVVVSTRGNVTDSYLGVPRSIFTNRATDLEGDE